MKALILVALATTVAHADPVIEGRAGPATIWDGVPERWTDQEFLAEQGRLATMPVAVPVHTLPPALPDAWYGEMRSRDKLVGWTVQGDARHGYTVVVDWNANGDLTDDSAIPFVPMAGGLEVY